MSSKRQASFAFSSKSPTPGWTAYSYEAAVPFFLLEAEASRATQIYSFASGINKEAFILVADLGEKAALIIRRPGKEGDPYLRLLLQKEEDFERAAGVLRKLDLVSDSLTAHANLSEAVELLRVGAERYFVNLGLFSNYFLRERLTPHLSERGRHIDKESAAFFGRLGGEIPADPEGAKTVLNELGYKPMLLDTSAHPEYHLLSGSVKLDAICVLTKAESLDTKKSAEVVPSYQAVSALKQVHWVILTNGRLWRLYSSRVSSSSTNYFEIDLDGITSESDPKLAYFLSLFSASSLAPKPQGSDLETIFEGGLKYAQEIRDELSRQVFEGQLFLNLVRAVISHSPSKKYGQNELEEAKATALRLLYRILFVLYAESRTLLPVGSENYDSISLEGLRQKLAAFEKLPEGDGVWQGLKTLFRSIENGNVKAGVPVYDGELFREATDLDGRTLKNEYLVSALRELTEINGKGIDYQNLGVRHLGSLYEALLEYSVHQAAEALVVYNDGTLDAAYAADLKAKPKPFVSKGELYLSSGGLARKGTGSYFTPDEIVKYLARTGLKPILDQRQQNFEAHLTELNAKRGRDPELEVVVVDDLLGIKVVDPAMGSGHFLVAAVDYITSWIMDRLKEHPEAPLARMIDEDREKVISEQKEKGVEITTELLTDNVILKRLVMKRCVYGVDINPLAVELAKLSLWLDSFTIGTPLTFLDHHIRCGDSLVGLWFESIKGKTFEKTLDAWTGALSSAGIDLFWKVSTAADLTIDEIDQSRRTDRDVRARTEPQRILLDLSVASALDPELGKKLVKNYMLIEQTYQTGGAKPAWWKDIEKALALARKYKAFQWEFEFLDAFSGEDRGFDLVITNPPWNEIRPYDDEFFSQYLPHFMSLATKTEKDRERTKLLKDDSIRVAHEEYVNEIQQKLAFIKNSGQYAKRGSVGVAFDSWALFLERALSLIREGGTLSILLPSGIVNNGSATTLRKTLLQRRIRAFYEFENKRRIFPAIDSRYKFVVLVVDKATSSEDISAAFRLEDLGSLEGNTEREKFVRLKKDFIELVSPDTLAIPEITATNDIRICERLYKSHPLLGERIGEWEFTIMRELGTESAKLYRTDGKGWPLMDGKTFNQFLVDYEKPTRFVNAEEGLHQTAKIGNYGPLNKEFHNTSRFAFRAIGSPTNVRSMIACILPKSVFTPHNAYLVLPRSNGQLKLGKEYSWMICYLAGVFNSMVFDYLMRLKGSITLSFPLVYQTPLPSQFKEGRASEIVHISAQLSCPDERFKELGEDIGVKVRSLSMEERIELSAKLNAEVARHYGVSKDELEFILNSFSFVENKEIVKMGNQIEWNDKLFREFNGEVRKRVMGYFERT